MPYFSIILPVYNGEKYLKTAIDSVLNQPVKDLEIILIDDGSTDSTLLICDTYAKAHKNIVVIHKRNEGVSEARNRGMEIARGDYILFLDSDDRFVENSINQEMLDDCNQGYDMLMYSSLRMNVDRCRYGIDMQMQDLIIPGRRALPISGHFGSCVYRREMLIENNIFFDLGVRLNEDEAFKMKAMYASLMIKSHSRFLYIHCTTPGSTKYREKHYFDFVIAWERTAEWLQKHGSGGNILQAQAYVQQKILSRLLLYAKLYIQQGHSKRELYAELQRLDAWERLRTLPVNQMIPAQRQELVLFQNDFAKFVRFSRREGRKIALGRFLIKNIWIRYIRDSRRMPWKKIEEINV